MNLVQEAIRRVMGAPVVVVKDNLRAGTHPDEPNAYVSVNYRYLGIVPIASGLGVFDRDGALVIPDNQRGHLEQLATAQPILGDAIPTRLRPGVNEVLYSQEGS